MEEHLSYRVELYPFYRKMNEQDFIFIHVPKTGGTSINRAFGFPKPIKRPYRIRKHNRLLEIKPLFTKHSWENAFKFCFVRNPWARIYSHYRFRKRGQKLKKEAHFDSFERWLFFELNRVRADSNLGPQVTWIKDNKGTIDLNYVGRFENLGEDFQKICEINNLQLTLPHFNKSVLSYDYRTKFNNEMIDLVFEAYKEDITCFNYSFH